RPPLGVELRAPPLEVDELARVELELVAQQREPVLRPLQVALRLRFDAGRLRAPLRARLAVALAQRDLRLHPRQRRLELAALRLARPHEPFETFTLVAARDQAEELAAAAAHALERREHHLAVAADERAPRLGRALLHRDVGRQQVELADQRR